MGQEILLDVSPFLARFVAPEPNKNLKSFLERARARATKIEFFYSEITYSKLLHSDLFLTCAS